MEEAHLCVPLLLPTIYGSRAEISLQSLQYSLTQIRSCDGDEAACVVEELYTRCDDVVDVGGVMGMRDNESALLQNNHETVPLDGISIPPSYSHNTAHISRLPLPIV